MNDFNAINVAYRSEFDKYIPAGYSVAIASEYISIHLNGMELLRINKKSEGCKVCTIGHTASFFSSEKNRIINALKHVQQCLKMRETLKTLNKCMVCTLGWRDNQNIAFDCDTAAALTDGHIRSKHHIHNMKTKMSANAYNIAETIEIERQISYAANAKNS